MSFETKTQGRLLFRIVASVVIIVFSVFAFYFLSIRFLSEIHKHRAKNYYSDGHYGLALSELKKANKYQPGDYRIQKELGKVYHKLGERKRKAIHARYFARKAKKCYERAARLNPYDAHVFYGLAKVESRLERLHRFLRPKERNPYQALPYYKEAIRLRPHGILYHYAFARYLYRHDKTEDLLGIVRSLTGIYPPVVRHLRKEKFWSPDVKEAVKEGLQEAVKDGILGRDAHKALSSMFAREKAWSGAISHYSQALQYRSFDNRTSDYFQLGRLYLNNEQIEEAKHNFLKGLAMSRSRERDLENLYNVFKKKGLMEELYGFYAYVNGRFRLSVGMDILLARTLMDMKMYDQARTVLEKANRKETKARTYSWLARIAEIEKDWDSMELAIQKATVLEPANMQYRRKFFRLLKQLGKLKSAERELGQIIKYSKKPSSGLYHERARMRWNRKDYTRAIDDWNSAIRLSPQNASFHAQVAEAYMKLEDWRRAEDYYEKAVNLDGKNKSYRKRYLELKGEM